MTALAVTVAVLLLLLLLLPLSLMLLLLLLRSLSVIRLRGADALLAVAAARCGLKVTIMRIINVDDGGDGVWMAQDTLPSLHTVGPAYAAFHMIEDSFLALGVNEEELTEDCEVKMDDVKWVVSLPGKGEGVVEGHIPTAPLLDAYVSGTGYFGNEAGGWWVRFRVSDRVRVRVSDSSQ